eukprot:UN09573
MTMIFNMHLFGLCTISITNHLMYKYNSYIILNQIRTI